MNIKTNTGNVYNSMSAQHLAEGRESERETERDSERTRGKASTCHMHHNAQHFAEGGGKGGRKQR